MITRRTLIRLTAAPLLLLIAGYLGLVGWHNRPAAPPETSALRTAQERAIGWLMDHRAEILQQNNPMLWRMIQQAAAASGDARLAGLFAAYRTRHLAGNARNIWRPLFDDSGWVPVSDAQLAALPYYNRHFIYALTCDTELGARPGIAAQNAADFCDDHPLRPACATHQLMGLRLMQRKGCGDATARDTAIAALQDRIERQLTWDPRAVDVFIQRLLMLTESGQRDRIRPAWMHTLLDSRQPSGGWSGQAPVFPFAASPVFTARGLGWRAHPASFHATAQGVYLLSLWLAEPGRAETALRL